MKFLKSLKKNNKGFSLVELIIVIAIMAVLVGTLAPQYVRYVEKSRMAADATTIDNFISVLEVIAATPDSGLATDKEGGYVITADNTNNYVFNTSDLDSISLYGELVDTSKSYSLKSTAYKSCGVNITLIYDGTKHIWKTSVTSATKDGKLPSTVN